MLLVSTVLPTAACETASKQRERELGKIARDWSMVIRASQVIPVYPMTEDLQPGDIFLVQRTVDEQHEAYTQDGFLAFENHLKRVHPSGYTKFYEESFLQETELAEAMPRIWLKPGETTSFDRAPGAAFPAYTFSVSRGSGFTAALPIQGVPVGLSLMNARSATGSVTIKDAHTYGVDIASLLPDVIGWCDRNREFLSAYGPRSDPAQPGATKHSFLRVVYRVYLTGRLNVSLNATSSFGAGGSAGAPKPVELPLLAPPTGGDPEAVNAANAESYRQGLAAINAGLAGSLVKDASDNLLPGATLKVIASSARSVSIDEQFMRPVAIGYLGFDMAILEDGELGPPLPTYAVLDRAVRPATDVVAPRVASALRQVDITTFITLAAIAEATDHPRKRDAGRLKERIDEMASTVLPAAYPAAIWTRASSGELVRQFDRGREINAAHGAFRALQSYGATLRGSVERLEVQQRAAALTDEQADDLDLAREELRRIGAVDPDLNGLFVRAGTLIGR